MSIFDFPHIGYLEMAFSARNEVKIAVEISFRRLVCDWAKLLLNNPGIQVDRLYPKVT
jgi:hypothetical protein